MYSLQIGNVVKVIEGSLSGQRGIIQDVEDTGTFYAYQVKIWTRDHQGRTSKRTYWLYGHEIEVLS